MECLYLILAIILILFELFVIVWIVNIVLVAVMFSADKLVDWIVDNFEALLFVCIVPLLL